MGILGEWIYQLSPDSKVHGANMGLSWVLSAPGGPHVVLAPWPLLSRIIPRGSLALQLCTDRERASMGIDTDQF